MKKAIVTGGDGFIGRCLVNLLLNNNYEVFVIGLNEKNIECLKTPKLHFIRAFFEDYQSLDNKIREKDFDLFFHFAWNGVYGEAFKDYEKQILNCKYTCDALMLAVKLNAQKFVLASTINVLETRHYMSCDSFEPRYTNIYSMAKLSSEMMCKTLAFQNNIEFNCGLISMVYGEKNFSKMVPNVVITNLLKGEESNLVEYNTKYDLIYVEDVADAFLHIGEKGKSQKTYYVGHSKLSTFGDIFTNIKNIVNPNGKLNFGVFKDKTCIDYELIDISSLERDTGFVPKTDFKESIIKTSKWLKEKMEEENNG